MANKKVGRPEPEIPQESKIMMRPLPQILDEMDDSIRTATEAARIAQEAAKAAREAAEKATTGI